MPTSGFTISMPTGRLDGLGSKCLRLVIFNAPWACPEVVYLFIRMKYLIVSLLGCMILGCKQNTSQKNNQSDKVVEVNSADTIVQIKKNLKKKIKSFEGLADTRALAVFTRV